ncbi:MAG: hypothetical protein WC775_04260 [Patescibacteria group bacterium]|jgi:hypothetical protein
MSKILVYSFYNQRHISFQLLDSLTEPVKKYYLGNINSLVKHIVAEKYDYILGIGSMRKGIKTMRVEKKFRNLRGRKPILPDGEPVLLANWDLSEQDLVVESENANIGPCNRSAYLLLDAIHKSSLFTKLAFLHVPNDFPIEKAHSTISNWLAGFV